MKPFSTDQQAQLAHLSAIIADSSDAIITKTIDGFVTGWNPAAEAIFGYSAEEMLGKPMLQLFPSDLYQEEVLILERLRNREYVSNFETIRRHKDGRDIHVSVSISPITDEHGQVVGASKIARDITQRKFLEHQLHLSSKVFTHTNDGIAITDASGSILDVNNAFLRITGFSRDEVIGKTHTFFRSDRQGPELVALMQRTLKREDHYEGELWSRNKSGAACGGRLAINAVRDEHGAIQNYVAIFADITTLKVQQAQLEQVAHYDTLTGLPNRILLADRLHQSMAMSKREGRAIGVLYIDLDGFKEINDGYGLKTGDDFLVNVAERIKAAIMDVDTVARIGGDEFVVVLENIKNSSECMKRANQILQACSVPVTLHGNVLRTSASMGVTVYPQDEADAEQLLRHADQAMYEVKQAGKNRCLMFDSMRHVHLRNRHDQIRSISLALVNQEFVLHYQPKVNMRTGHVIGAEALIRWDSPEHGLLRPGAFLPAIEDDSISDWICEWVIQEALQQVRRWKLADIHIPVSVNVGARQLQQKDFVNRLSLLLKRFHDVSPSSLELEVLETSALNDTKVAQKVMQDCRLLGVTFAVDDFGTGYSSLTHLKRIPADVLKIDQTFVREMLVDREELAIVQGVIGLAKSFNKKVLAEGVETVEHGLKLLELGCEYAQGYGISRPIAPDEFVIWMKSWKPDPRWMQQ